jgi:sec-independent protein translocase protein TatA
MGLGGLGMWEMIMIFLVVLLLFGAKRLPEIGSSLGKGIREFKGSIKEIEKEVKAVGEPQRDAEPPRSTPPAQQDEGPRRLTTSPGPESGAGHSGGVPTMEAASDEVSPAVSPEEVGSDAVGSGEAESTDLAAGQEGPTGKETV